MQSRIIGGIKAGLAQNRLSLCFAAVVDQNPRADSASIRLHTFELHLEPILFSTQIVPQQRRSFIQIHNQNVDVAIIVEIPESASAAAMGRRYAMSRSVDEFLELAVPQVSKHSARRLVGILRQLAFNFGINVAGYHEQVGVAVIVQITNSGSPADVAN